MLLLLLLLRCFSRVRLCATSWTAAHQALPSLGFSRQDHGSGLPFPSPMRKSESEVAQLCLTLLIPWTAAYQAPLFMGFPGKSTGVGCHCLLLGSMRGHLYAARANLDTDEKDWKVESRKDWTEGWRACLRKAWRRPSALSGDQ